MKASRAGTFSGWSGGPRPCALAAPAAAVVVMAGLLAVLARTTGSGWLVVMASGLVPIFVIGAVAPIIPLSRARAALQLPADAMVGRTVAVTVTVEGRARGLTMRLREPASGWVHLDAPTSGTIPAVPSHRGVLASVVVELRSAAPFGLVVWQRKIVVPCPRPLDVAPVPIVGRAPITRADARGEASEGAGSRRGADSVRGIRPYAAGDPFRIVHWPATARWGGVMVRELDDDAPPDLVLVVDLSGGDLDATEARASLAAGLADDALASGRRVLLATVERAGPVTAVAETPTEVGRRLARAVSGEPVPPAIRSGDVVVRVARETALTER